jgi:transposase
LEGVDHTKRADDERPAILDVSPVVPIAGPITAARILVTVGDPARFRSAGALAAYVGVVPGTKESGLRRSPRAHLSPLGNARLRKALSMTTRKNGKLPKVALVAAMRKLLAAVYSAPRTPPLRLDGESLTLQIR